MTDGVQGDSTDASFPKSIEVLDWSWGVTTATSPTNTARGAGKSKPQPFTFVAHNSSDVGGPSTTVTAGFDFIENAAT